MNKTNKVSNNNNSGSRDSNSKTRISTRRRQQFHNSRMRIQGFQSFNSLGSSHPCDLLNYCDCGDDVFVNHLLQCNHNSWTNHRCEIVHLEQYNPLLPNTMEGNVFRGICQSFCSRGGRPLGGRFTSRWRSPWMQTPTPCKEYGTRQEVTSYSPWKECGTRWEVASYTAPCYWHLVAGTAAVGTHPTGMHSYSMTSSHNHNTGREYSI